FGFSVSESFGIIQEIGRYKEGLLVYTGLQFHLNGYSTEDRAAAIEQCIQLIDALAEEGIQTHSLDIGGGFLMNYLADKAEWEVFHRELKRAVMGQRKP